MKFFYLVTLLALFFEVQNVNCQFSITLDNYIDLPEEVVETSGILVYNNLIWTFNDSGGEPELYGIENENYQIKKVITIWNGTNFDWEEVTQDSNYIYIGDFGNNFGNRNNLCIYRLGKKSMLRQGNQLLGAERIHFTYPDYSPQSYFSFNKSAFDCEAMVCVKDSIYLFSKDWVTEHSIIYAIPNKPGKYIAHKIGEFNARCLVTSATFNGKDLLLLGYSKYHSYLWIFRNIKNFSLNENQGERMEITELLGAQAEGITFVNDKIIYITSERSTIPQRLWIFNYKF